ncbi:MAG: bifunctional nuclease family protein [Candidatus Bipolaricaulota bacterium]|nr:bifunctional nuclease family protein [Candidatus Bipolaricaulota bacterium]
MREVEVRALVMDPTQNTPVLLLRDPQSKKVVPVWIGQPEATSIAMVMQQREFPRPLAHDLVKAILKAFGGDLDMIVIDSIQDSTYFATLYVRDHTGKTHEIDARPSDSIAIALRLGSPIYVSEEVFQVAAVEMPAPEDEGMTKENEDRFKTFVESEMKLADFKRFVSDF